MTSRGGGGVRRSVMQQAVRFLQSEKGQQAVASVRRKVDTPENREKAARLVATARERAEQLRSRRPR
jgi:hypothetical protein